MPFYVSRRRWLVGAFLMAGVTAVCRTRADSSRGRFEVDTGRTVTVRRVTARGVTEWSRVLGKGIRCAANSADLRDGALLVVWKCDGDTFVERVARNGRSSGAASRLGKRWQLPQIVKTLRRR